MHFFWAGGSRDKMPPGDYYPPFLILVCGNTLKMTVAILRE